VNVKYGKSWKQRQKRRPAIIGIKTAPRTHETKTHQVKKGTLFDDESFIVQQGTEPNRIDRYGGWPESIHHQQR
jgi:hypothetical protein